MKILIYGAGVLGSYLAHVLIRGGNEVTILARGQRLEELSKSGLIIRHYIQLKTTYDKVKVIGTLSPDDTYDLIFVVMQYSQLKAVLPIVSANNSSHIVFVGNNADAASVQKYIQENSPVKKHIAFGFQATGGRRENGRIICIRTRGHMVVGGLDNALSWQPQLDKAFSGTKYKLTYVDDMNSWLIRHIAAILPLCFASHACQGTLRKAWRNKLFLNQIIDAIDEGYKILEALGTIHIPPHEADIVRKKRSKFYIMLNIVVVTPIGRLAISDHAMNAIEEMTALSDQFDVLKAKANIATPNWDALEGYLIRK